MIASFVSVNAIFAGLAENIKMCHNVLILRESSQLLMQPITNVARLSEEKISFCSSLKCKRQFSSEMNPMVPQCPISVVQLYVRICMC